MPTNLYGPGDNYHPANSHVLPAMIRRLHEAVERGSTTVVCCGGLQSCNFAGLEPVYERTI